jgi:hypothetical protein
MERPRWQPLPSPSEPPRPEAATNPDQSAPHPPTNLHSSADRCHRSSAILNPMRRVLAITLLLAFGSPLLAPLFAATADPQASLPACCRRHGTHHCSMNGTTLDAGNGPVFRARPCPFYPATSTAPRLVTASLTAASALARSLRQDPAPPRASPRGARTASLSANLNRGPPTRSA